MTSGGNNFKYFPEKNLCIFLTGGAYAPYAPCTSYAIEVLRHRVYTFANTDASSAVRYLAENSSALLRLFFCQIELNG